MNNKRTRIFLSCVVTFRLRPMDLIVYTGTKIGFVLKEGKETEEHSKNARLSKYCLARCFFLLSYKIMRVSAVKDGFFDWAQM